MRLTKKKAINISIELWTWLAETGRKKWEWPGWDRYGKMQASCPLCEYGMRKATRLSESSTCGCCPYREVFGTCLGPLEELRPFTIWTLASTPEDKKKYASLFLEQLKQF